MITYGGVPSESGTESAVEDSISSVENVPVKIEVFDDDNDSFEGNFKVIKAWMVQFRPSFAET